MLLKSDQKDNRKCDGFDTKNTVQLQKKPPKSWRVSVQKVLI